MFAEKLPVREEVKYPVVFDGPLTDPDAKSPSEYSQYWVLGCRATALSNTHSPFRIIVFVAMIPAALDNSEGVPRYSADSRYKVPVATAVVALPFQKLKEISFQPEALPGVRSVRPKYPAEFVPPPDVSSRMTSAAA